MKVLRELIESGVFIDKIKEKKDENYIETSE